MAATSRWGSTSTSVETSSPFSFRYSRVLRRLEMSFLVGFMARTSTVKPFACGATRVCFPAMDSRDLEPDIETAARATLRAVQEQRLHEQVEHAYQSSPFYRRKLDAAGVKPADVRSLDDLRRLPFTTKDELKQDQADHPRSEEHTSELQSHSDLVCRLLLEKKKMENKSARCVDGVGTIYAAGASPT